ncbi:substrate-binding domain-containing protein [Christensenella tenuis]|jgi:ribose transport system substrate-binding protein|uniref:Substrate-binding domain-containing protein n=1 Tax=Christensenella tenuis TaxID=2763033 RepID=A0ABR7EEK1_9FIRM|nr:substrate-binding domain-containing protein [Christensenella tenuis]MBC5648212.1 substrate-binding domain-containing protein [Christensenella tenuis]
MRKAILMKYVALMLAAVLALTLIGCSAAPAEESTAASAEPTQAASEEPAESASAEAASTPSTESAVGTGDEVDYMEGFDLTKDGFVIGFSNSYNGNTYRQTEEALFKELADKLKAEGVLSDYIIVESNQDNATQVSQIQSLVLKGVDAIIVDPGSATALNGAIEDAEAAGVPVIIANGGPVTTDKCYQINFDYTAAITPAAEYVVDRLNGKGDVLISRGIAGVPSDDGFYAGMMQVFEQYPDINIVGEVYSEWTTSVAQQQIASILPSLDNVDAVIGEGGDGYGAVQAFEAANREVPLVIGGNRGNFLSWWANEYEENGYETYSWTTNPGITAAGLFVAVDILRGKDVPREMNVGSIEITQQDMVDNIDYYKSMDADAIANQMYTYQWVQDTLYTQ